MRTIVVLGAGFSMAVSALAAPALRGNAGNGERLFKELKCVACHSVKGAGGKSAPALGAGAGQLYTPNTMAGAMWSHATAMWQAMDQAGIRRPQLTEQQAADLYAFFAGSPSADKPGDPKRGQQIYQAKLCASCHDMPDTGAPSLAVQAGRVSSFWMVSALWQHGAGMLSRMAAKKTDWQRLTAGEMGHIIAYLNAKK